MSIEFLSELGFSADPFASTNAADEPLIGQYFVEPPFFPAVVGDPRHPKSNVVFAPRGGGKTAQKIMIENKSGERSDFLCISYDRFPVDKVPNNGSVTAEYHLSNLCRHLAMGILLTIETNESSSGALTKEEKAS